MKEINFYSRKVEYGFLSNFWQCPQVVDNVEYATNEHYYQSQKANNDATHDWVNLARTPYHAMRRGRSIDDMDLRDDWDEVKVDIMLKGLRSKFSNPELRQLLIDTGDAVLHEDSPTDMFWGKKGKDQLGKLLMLVREENQDTSTRH